MAVVDRQKCIGCGLYVTGCTAGTVELVLKPENEVVEPPKDLIPYEEGCRRDPPLVLGGRRTTAPEAGFGGRNYGQAPIKS